MVHAMLVVIVAVLLASSGPSYARSIEENSAHGSL